ncbi:hypothetical protein JCM10213_005798 [Rhodosporidiobolus nylandii]
MSSTSPTTDPGNRVATQTDAVASIEVEQATTSMDLDPPHSSMAAVIASGESDGVGAQMDDNFPVSLTAPLHGVLQDASKVGGMRVKGKKPRKGERENGEAGGNDEKSPKMPSAAASVATPSAGDAADADDSMGDNEDEDEGEDEGEESELMEDDEEDDLRTVEEKLLDDAHAERPEDGFTELDCAPETRTAITTRLASYFEGRVPDGTDVLSFATQWLEGLRQGAHHMTGDELDVAVEELQEKLVKAREQLRECIVPEEAAKYPSKYQDAVGEHKMAPLPDNLKAAVLRYSNWKPGETFSGEVDVEGPSGFARTEKVWDKLSVRGPDYAGYERAQHVFPNDTSGSAPHRTFYTDKGKTVLDEMDRDVVQLFTSQRKPVLIYGTDALEDLQQNPHLEMASVAVSVPWQGAREVVEGEDVDLTVLVNVYLIHLVGQSPLSGTLAIQSTAPSYFLAFGGTLDMQRKADAAHSIFFDEIAPYGLARPTSRHTFEKNVESFTSPEQRGARFSKFVMGCATLEEQQKRPLSEDELFKRDVFRATALFRYAEKNADDIADIEQSGIIGEARPDLPEEVRTSLVHKAKFLMMKRGAITRSYFKGLEKKPVEELTEEEREKLDKRNTVNSRRRAYYARFKLLHPKLRCLSAMCRIYRRDWYWNKGGRAIVRGYYKNGGKERKQRVRLEQYEFLLTIQVDLKRLLPLLTWLDLTRFKLETLQTFLAIGGQVSRVWYKKELVSKLAALLDKEGAKIRAEFTAAVEAGEIKADEDFGFSKIPLSTVGKKAAPAAEKASMPSASLPPTPAPAPSLPASTSAPAPGATAASSTATTISSKKDKKKPFEKKTKKATSSAKVPQEEEDPLVKSLMGKGRKKGQYVCDHPGCGKTYARKDALSSHQKAKHLGTSRHVCSVCSKVFDTKFNLTTHQQVHNKVKVKYSCVCGQTFGLKGNSTRHKKTCRHHQEAGSSNAASSASSGSSYGSSSVVVPPSTSTSSANAAFATFTSSANAAPGPYSSPSPAAFSSAPPSSAALQYQHGGEQYDHQHFGALASASAASSSGGGGFNFGPLAMGTKRKAEGEDSGGGGGKKKKKAKKE